MSLKVTVNGRKFQVSGITKQTSCKDLLCALAKATANHDTEESKTNSRTSVLVDEKTSTITHCLTPLSLCDTDQGSQNNLPKEETNTENKPPLSAIKNSEADHVAHDNSTVLNSTCHEPCDTDHKRKHNRKHDFQQSTAEAEGSQVGIALEEVSRSHSREKTRGKRKQNRRQRRENLGVQRGGVEKHQFEVTHANPSLFNGVESDLTRKGSSAKPSSQSTSGIAKSKSNTLHRNCPTVEEEKKLCSPLGQCRREEVCLQEHLRHVLGEQALEIKEVPVDNSPAQSKKLNKGKNSTKKGKRLKKKLHRDELTAVSSPCLSNLRSKESLHADNTYCPDKSLPLLNVGEHCHLKEYTSLLDLTSRSRDIKTQMKEIKKAEFLEELRKSSPTYIIDKDVTEKELTHEKIEPEIENDNDSGVQTVEYDSSQEIDNSPRDLSLTGDDESGLGSCRNSPESRLKERTVNDGEGAILKHSKSSGLEDGIEQTVNFIGEPSSAPRKLSVTSFDDSFLHKSKEIDNLLPLVSSVSTTFDEHAVCLKHGKRRPSLRKTDNCLDLCKASTSSTESVRSNGSSDRGIVTGCWATSPAMSCEYGTINRHDINNTLNATETLTRRDSINRKRHSIPRSESLTELSLVSVESDCKTGCSDNRREEGIGDKTEDRCEKDSASARAAWQEKFSDAKLWFEYRQLTQNLMDLLDELLYKDLMIVHLSVKLEATEGYTTDLDDECLAMEEMAIAKDLMVLKNLIRSVTQLSRYQRRDVADVVCELDQIDWEIKSRLNTMQCLEVKLANMRTKGAPRALVKRRKGNHTVNADGENEESDVVSLV